MVVNGIRSAVVTSPAAATPAGRVPRQRAAGRAGDRLGHRGAAALPDDVGLQLLENAAATAAGLFAIILMFGPVSGGHFNPVVSLVDAAFGGLTPARRARLHPGADRRLRRRRGARQRHVRARRGEHLHPPPREPGAPARPRSSRLRAAAGDLLPRAHRPAGDGARRGRRLHRRRLLVHELDQLRQPGDHHRPRRSRTHSPASRPRPCPGSSLAQLAGAAVAVAIRALIRSALVSRHMSPRAVRLPPQRRPLPDQPGAVRTRRRGPAQRGIGGQRRRPRRPRAPGGRRGHARARHRPRPTAARNG